MYKFAFIATVVSLAALSACTLNTAQPPVVAATPMPTTTVITPPPPTVMPGSGAVIVHP